MKKILNVLFTTSVLRIPNWALWILLVSGLPLVFIEGGDSDGFERISFVFIVAGLVMAAISVAYNLNREKR